jgi:hypothetical protein
VVYVRHDDNAVAQAHSRRSVGVDRLHVELKMIAPVHEVEERSCLPMLRFALPPHDVPADPTSIAESHGVNFQPDSLGRYYRARYYHPALQRFIREDPPGTLRPLSTVADGARRASARLAA